MSFLLLSVVGDLVWNDQDGDGLQQPSYLPGINVTLQTCKTNITVATTTTDENGNYLFTNIASACYHVVFSGAPAGFVATRELVGTDDTINSDIDANGVTGDFVPVTVFFQNVDAGYVNSSGC